MPEKNNHIKGTDQIIPQPNYQQSSDAELSNTFWLVRRDQKQV